MTQTAGAILRKKVSAIQTRGYSFPIQSELAAKLEYAITCFSGFPIVSFFIHFQHLVNTGKNQHTR